MSSIFRRVVTTKRIEYVIPTEPYYACWVELAKAIHSCHQELIANGLLPDAAEAADDQIRVRVGDDEVVLYVEVSEAKG